MYMNGLIISIGDELLIGQVTNTNAAYIARQLNLYGISVNKVLTIRDKETDILQALQEGLQYDLVIITGGLGPTKDDITKHTLAKFMQDELVEDALVRKDIESLLSVRGRVMNELNKQQALVLRRAKVIRNFTGTAPGMILKKNNTTFVSLPGVPFEMKHTLMSFLKDYTSENAFQNIIHRTVLVFGLPESELAIKLEHWENQLQKDNIQLAYLPNRNLIRLRLSVYQAQNHTNKLLHTRIEELKTLLGKHYVGEENFDSTDENPLAKVVFQKLKEKQWKIAFAESCTGGSVSAVFTRIAGVSEVFKGSVVSYTNEVKQNLLKVQPHTLKEHGAVSKACVEEMVKGVAELMGTDLALSVSGIAGPTGGTAEKPVGTVWMALYWHGEVESKLFQFGNNSREHIIDSTVYQAFAWILKKTLML